MLGGDRAGGSSGLAKHQTETIMRPLLGILLELLGVLPGIARSITRDITRFTRIYRNVARVVLGACQEPLVIWLTDFYRLFGLSWENIPTRLLFRMGRI